jgi:hypothetical protein
LTTTAKETAAEAQAAAAQSRTQEQVILSDWKNALLKVQNETSSKSALRKH